MDSVVPNNPFREIVDKLRDGKVADEIKRELQENSVFLKMIREPDSDTNV